MIYLDTSSLLKLLLPEPESPEVLTAVAREPSIAVSSLTELEARVQLRAMRLGGELTVRQLARLETRLAQVQREQPFHAVRLPASLIDSALRQHTKSARHCRTLDRLHLAAMEELGIRRLMTHDQAQAATARELGFEVLSPGAI